VLYNSAVESSRHPALELEIAEPRPAAAGGLCPVDRLPTRRRNQICIAIIAVGALNFLAYTATYAILGGDAHNGEARLVAAPDGTARPAYFVRGHFIHNLRGKATEVSRGLWIYSYLHSMSVFITSAAMIISMLVLARPHILATMRDGWLGGRTFVFTFGGLVILVPSAALLMFARDFLIQLHGP